MQQSSALAWLPIPAEITKCALYECIVVITSHNLCLTRGDVHEVFGGLFFILDDASPVWPFLGLGMIRRSPSASEHLWYDSEVLFGSTST